MKKCKEVQSRRRRHRKLLKVGEFQQLAFRVVASFPTGSNTSDTETLAGAFFDALASRGLEFDGLEAPSIDGRVMSGDSRSSPSDRDRTYVAYFLVDAGFSNVQVGHLVDAWYTPPQTADVVELPPATALRKPTPPPPPPLPAVRAAR